MISKEPNIVFKEIGAHFVTVFERKKQTRVKIIDLIRQNPSITIPEIAEKIDLTIKGVEWNIKILKKEGILQRVGSLKGGHWEVKGK